MSQISNCNLCTTIQSIGVILCHIVSLYESCVIVSIRPVLHSDFVDLKFRGGGRNCPLRILLHFNQFVFSDPKMGQKKLMSGLLQVDAIQIFDTTTTTTP